MLTLPQFTPFELSIPRCVLKAALLNTGPASNLPRHPMARIFLDAEGYVISTSGGRLFAWKHPTSWSALLPPTGALILHGDVKGFLSRGKPATACTLDISEAYIEAATEGRNPLHVWRRTIPVRPSGIHPAGFVPSDLEIVSRQSKLLGGGGIPRIVPNGRDAAVAYISPVCVVAVMPYRQRPDEDIDPMECAASCYEDFMRAGRSPLADK